MFKWNYFILLVFLVPPTQALEKSPATVEPDLSTKLFREIDGYFSELILNHVTLLKHESLCSSDGFGDFDYDYPVAFKGRDLTLAPMVKAKFKLLEKHVHSLKLVKECPNMENNINEYRNLLKSQP